MDIVTGVGGQRVVRSAVHTMLVFVLFYEELCIKNLKYSKFKNIHFAAKYNIK